jgi:enoyl-[acyl-carrier-protein] reductase (NADH)
MLRNDFTDKAVLITGGTKGLGRAIGLAFAEHQAQVYLTCKWGSAAEEEVLQAFRERGARPPVLLEADAAHDGDTAEVLARIQQDHDAVEVFVSNVSFAPIGGDLMSYQRRFLHKSLEYGTWPMVGHLQQIKQVFGRYPRYTLGTSCDGPDTYYPGYDFVAVAKSVMETFCRYMAKELFEEQRACINILRSRPVSTDSLVATFGPDFEPFLKRYYGEDYFIEADAVGQAALALCSGLLDAMTGQVVLLDKGVGFQDNLMRLFEHRHEYGLAEEPAEVGET